ncbi:coiled-coil domain-containing protein 192 isoform X3 [Monodelphis domestica]|uniref:coiled-coil domain-containing protein 192 isoform X3 n=1 Tax=Monodelphis domestica TaxID=13616 RepID=UPI00044319AD|nr:coiled-coil domain-containing protein 192 isoform X3 [Monodelphis domestica]
MKSVTAWREENCLALQVRATGSVQTGLDRAPGTALSTKWSVFKYLLAVSEGTKTKLLEQVSWLEEQLETADIKEVRGEPYEEIMHAKNQRIEKLQAEVKASQEQLAAHKLKHKRKMKKLQTDLATAKQEAAITVLELNEKIKTLYEGKPSPRGCLRISFRLLKCKISTIRTCILATRIPEENSLEESCGGLPPVEEGDRRMSLIMELSTQVSLQTEKINQLEEVLEEKERKIQQLEAERETPMFQMGSPPECLPEAPSASNDRTSAVDID